MALSTRTLSQQEAQLAALRALAAELSGERRQFQRQPLEPGLSGQLELHTKPGAAVPLLLMDLGSGGARALAPASAALQAGSLGRLLTAGPGGREGQRQVRVRWIRPEGNAQLLGLSFEVAPHGALRQGGSQP